MKYVIVLLLLLSGCTPVRYVHIKSHESQRTVRNHQHLNVPLYYGHDFLFRPFYQPIIIQRHRPIVLPKRNHHTRPNRFRR